MKEQPSIMHISIPKDGLYTWMYTEAGKGMYVAYLRGSRCKTEDDFFKEISAALQFPDYFGENWPALDECLCDLEWLRLTGILLAVDDFSFMFSGQKELQEMLKERTVKYFTIMADYWISQNIPIQILLNN